MNVEEFLSRHGSLIEREVKGRLTELLESAKAYHPLIGELYSKLGEFILRGGKRLASCSTILTYIGYGNRVDERIVKASAGIEFYRHSILVHDDLVDRDPERRRGETIHVTFAKKRNGRFGEGVAIFAGNILYALATRSLLGSGFRQELANEAVSLLAEAYKEVNESQILDLFFEAEEPKVDEWYAMASRRAASLFKAAILIGATLGEAPREDLKILREAALNIGYSFDIQDDIIDLFASKEEYGRSPGRDLCLGKKPLHMVYALSMAGGDRVREIKACFGKRKLSPRGLDRVRGIVKRSGALDAAKSKSRAHAEEAKKLL
ncbi:TPA: polyprenyl synthetase family protein, partial [Candidatus Bathyarchaeota archaeon]|nr:polyprenyl synthetase family protein [Candidatus Bathyarchaeota archaeon]